MSRDGLDRDTAGWLTQAYWAWFAFVAALVAFGVIALWEIEGQDSHAGALFYLAAAWSVLVVPTMLFIKGHVIRAGWESRPADPATYFKGLMIVWATIEIGAVLALIGCMVSEATLPGGLLAGILLTLLVAMRPAAAALGQGMTPAEG